MIRGLLHICNECGGVFERPEIIRGSNPGSPRDSDVPDEYVCPFCGSDDYDQAYKCDRCGEVVRNNLLEYGICPDCLSLMAKEHYMDFIFGNSEIRDAFAWYVHTHKE